MLEKILAEMEYLRELLEYVVFGDEADVDEDYSDEDYLDEDEWVDEEEEDEEWDIYEETY